MRLCSYAQDALKIFPFPVLPCPASPRLRRHAACGCARRLLKLAKPLLWSDAYRMRFRNPNRDALTCCRCPSPARLQLDRPAPTWSRM